ncbi:hypothetical protein PFY12_05605 [Chryseobacterium camelliae]|uniref:Uncharacterized protein n=1 Tax=Chryseobacterium camelliae TaxID=1265445 RepID=A0ABY7QS12_9FLAO|nr:hypothetical protein [Chryseobacterium camelliae]WBV61598.1 hypothetical protein PFY12_05605 [Chryseobacterium camelliae]
MENEICTITLTGDQSEQYTFYSDNTIKKIDNTDNLKPLIEWLSPKQINKHNKDRIIRSCPEDVKEIVMQILDYP